MSMTAQRMDIADPEVIQQFALQVGDKLHLDYLYAMTVADICATNPTLWNTWRAALLRQLYLSTKRALRRGLENPIDRADRIKDKQESVMLKLTDRGIGPEQIEHIWANVDDEYFVRESSANIAWHTEAVARNEGQDTLILVEDTSDTVTEGGTQIFIYTLNRNHLFASTASAIEKLGLNIMDARIFTSAKNYCMNTFTVLESDGTPVSGSIVRRKEIIGLIREYLLDPSQHLKASTKRIDRKLKHFSRHVETEVINSDDNPYTTLEINCPDQPGILASIGKIFADHNIQLQNARIATLGERVEDLFFILDTDNRKITDAEDIEKLQNDIRQELGD
jgi:[protein-PII] uridylyltransferase